MTKFRNSDENLEIKKYLHSLSNILKQEEVMEDIMNKNLDKLRQYVVNNKLIEYKLGKITIEDPELAFLAGKFIATYDFIESYFKRCADKEYYENLIDYIVQETINGLDILSDIYCHEGISKEIILKKNSNDMEDASKVLDILKRVDLIKEDDESYRLSKEAKRYMKEKYFLNDNEEEETNDNKTGLVRSKTLRLLDNEMEE